MSWMHECQTVGLCYSRSLFKIERVNQKLQICNYEECTLYLTIKAHLFCILSEKLMGVIKKHKFRFRQRFLWLIEGF